MSRQQRDPGDDLADARREAEAGGEPDGDHDDELETFVAMSASVRPVRTRRARHRQRAEAVDQAFLEVLGEAERRDEAAERHRLHDDPRHQEVDVVVARRLDRAAEDVDEEQHEHDRLDREAEQQVGLARGCGAGCASRSRACRRRRSGAVTRASPCRRRSSSASAACPVSAGRRRRASAGGPRCRRSRCRRRRAAARPRRSRRAAGAAARAARRPRRTGSPSAIGASAATAASRARGVPEPHLEAVAADLRLQLVRTCPRRSRRPWSITAIRSASRSASSRYCVVSSTVVPSATSASIASQSPMRLREVEAGRRLVEEEHRRAGDERRGEVEPAAHAARVGAHEPVAGVGELEGGEQLARALARRAPRPRW